MKLRLQIEPRVVFLVTVHCDRSIIWLHILIDIREKQRKMATTYHQLLLYSVFIKIQYYKVTEMKTVQVQFQFDEKTV